MKHTKVGTSNLETDAKTGKGHKTSHNIQIQRTNVYTAQVITGHMTAQQSISTRPHLPPILLVVQVHILITPFLDFKNPSPQHHFQQSQSMIGSSTLTLMVDKNLWFQQGPQGQVTPPGQNRVNQQVRPSQPVNSQYNQLNIHQQSPVFPPQQFNAQYPPPYPGQWPHSCHLSTQMLLKQVKY